jgi:putative peptidoglycan lipid II flippase
VLRTTARCLLAVLVPSLVALLACRLAWGAFGRATTGSAVGLVAGGAVLGIGYLAVARRVRVREVDLVLAPLLRLAQDRRVIGRTR